MKKGLITVCAIVGAAAGGYFGYKNPDKVKTGLKFLTSKFSKKEG